MGESDGEKIEFNSMVAVLKRLSNITDRINATRFEKTLQAMNDMAHLLGEYYKEISTDLSGSEPDVWKDIKKIQKQVMSPHRTRASWAIWQDLDEIDLKLRKYAKKHGYLTKNSEDQKAAIIN